MWAPALRREVSSQAAVLAAAAALTLCRFPQGFLACWGSGSFYPGCPLSGRTWAARCGLSASSPASAGEVLGGNPWGRAGDSLPQLPLLPGGPGGEGAPISVNHPRLSLAPLCTPEAGSQFMYVCWAHGYVGSTSNLHF